MASSSTRLEDLDSNDQLVEERLNAMLFGDQEKASRAREILEKVKVLYAECEKYTAEKDRLQSKLEEIYRDRIKIHDLFHLHDQIEENALSSGFNVEGKQYDISSTDLARFIAQTKRIADQLYDTYLSRQHHIGMAFVEIEVIRNQIAYITHQFESFKKQSNSRIVLKIFEKYQRAMRWDEGSVSDVEEAILRKILREI